MVCGLYIKKSILQRSMHSRSRSLLGMHLLKAVSVQPAAENGLNENLEKLVVDFPRISSWILSLLLEATRSSCA